MNLTDRIYIAGHKGLIGSAILRKLKLVGYTRILTQTHKSLDLMNRVKVERFFAKEQPEYVILAAAKVGGIYANNTKRTEFIMENLKINMNILESIIDNKNIKLINLGSSCIYPLNAPNPIGENSFMDGKLEPTNSPYAMAKLSAIEIGRSISTQHGHKVINLMPTNLYGPNDFFSESDSHVIPGMMYRMYSSMINHESEFSIWGSGKPLREFLYVEDLAKAILHIIKNEITII